jgi:hypothetical protein
VRTDAAGVAFLSPLGGERVREEGSVLVVREPPIESAPRTLTAIEVAVIEALCYADAFDWPLAADEVHRFLPIPADRAGVDLALGSLGRAGVIQRASELVSLAGRGGLVRRRRALEASSRTLWPQARRAAAAIARLPFVRFVGVTGSLAVNAATADDDIDLFIVTADDRLWLTRAAAIGVVRSAAVAGTTLCPNYLLAESALELPPAERDRFTAHELAQLVPLAGPETYDRLLQANAWYRALLPNHRPTARPARRAGARALEGPLRAGPLDRLERWEMERKVARFARRGDGETRFGPTVCKGHFDGHRARALAAYEERRATVLRAAEEAAA